MIHFALLLAFVFLQTPKPKFDAASIKPNNSGAPRVEIEVSKGLFRATNMSVRTLLRFAFDPHLPADEMDRAGALWGTASGLEIIGGPSWMSNDRFDVIAKPPDGPPVPQEQMQLMMQSLLEDRFQVKAHYEMREAPTFDLVVVKPGKMQQSSGNNPPRRNTPSGQPLPNIPSGRLSTFVLGRPDPGSAIVETMYGNAVPISSLVSAIQSWAGRRVIDKTNLNGLYDVYLQFSPEQAVVDPAGPSIFTAIQQELGLKLESSRGSTQVLVIDSIQKPSEN